MKTISRILTFILNLFLVPRMFPINVICGSISASIVPDCDNPMVAGADDVLILVNKADIDSVTKNGANPLIIEDMLLASGTSAYSYTGKNNSNEPSHVLVRKDFAEVYEHTIKFKVFKNDGATKKQLEELAAGRVVAIVLNNHRGAAGNSAYEIYGLDSGLILTAHSRNVADDATQGAYDLELKSSPKALEPHVPATFYITSFAATKAIVDGLV